MSEPIGADEMLDRIEELEVAIKRQASASKKLRSFDLERTRHLEAIDRSEYTAAKTLDSERQANEMLTDRIEELEAQLAKAVEALEQIATHRKKCHEYDDDVGHERRTFDVEDMIIMEYAARTTLAELKGHLICLKPLE